MHKLRKVLSVLLASSIVLPTALLAACGSDDADTISEDDPWYDMSVVEIGSNYKDSDEYEYTSTYFVGVYDGNYLCKTDGSIKEPEDFDWEHDDYSSLQICKLDLYSSDGSVVKSVDLAAAFKDMDIDYDWFNIGEITLNDSTITARVNVTNENGMNYEDLYYDAVVDIESGEFTSFDEVNGDVQINNASNEGTVDVGDGYTLTKYYLWDDDGSGSSYILVVKGADGSTNTINMKELFPNQTIWNIDSVIPNGDGTVMVCTSSEDGQIWYKLDLDTLSMTQEEFDNSWLNGYDLYNLKYVDGIGSVVCNTNGITHLDFDSKTAETLFTFDECNYDYGFNSANLVSYSEDQIVLSASKDESITGIDYNEVNAVITLTKADKNPNAGKEIVEAASVTYLDSGIAYAIYQFNETNEDYFIKLNNDYSIDNYYNGMTYNDDTDWVALSYEASTEMSNKLAIDLMAGDGPDVIINGQGYRQLNSDDYLLDLSDRISGDSYFMGAIDSAKTNGKLYQIPLAFAVRGIMVPSDSIADGQYGFTFDQYNQFVDEVCNGDNPIQAGQLDAFNDIISGMSDLFVDENGSYDFDNEAFRATAEYVKENYPEEFVWGDDMMYWDPMSEDVQTMYLYGMGSFLNNYGSKINRISLVGYPSYDGRGTSYVTSASVAVAKETNCEDGCLAFVDMLLSTDVQSHLAGSSVPVNKDAFNQIASMTVDQYNAQIAQYSNWMSEAEMQMYGYEAVDQSAVDHFCDIIENASGFADSTDAAVQKILREEIPPYFADQKPIDQVITIINDKVNTYIKERG